MNATSLAQLRIVILAAGFSSRLGRPKALARIHGVTLLRRALKLASSLKAADILAVVPRNAARYRVETRGTKVILVVNPHRAQGLASSVRLGIARSRYSPAILFVPVDMVNLTGGDLNRLVRARQSARRRVIARRIGTRGAAPMILPRRLYSPASGIAGDVGLRLLMAQLPGDSVELIDLPSAALDIDTPKDLNAARASFRARVRRS
jgi:molybdenum cofactor cytidylyltransferase